MRFPVYVAINIACWGAICWVIRWVWRRIATRHDVERFVGMLRLLTISAGLRQAQARDVQFAIADAVVRLRDVGVSGATFVPAEVEVVIGDEDWGRVGRAIEWTAAEVRIEIERQCEVAGWDLTGPVRVALVLDPAVRSLRPQVRSSTTHPTCAEDQLPVTTPIIGQQSGPALRVPHEPPGVTVRRVPGSAGGAVRVDEPLAATAACPGLFCEPDNERFAPVRAGSGDDSVLVGRSDTADVVIDEPTVSSHHCLFFRRDGRWYVRDTASKNGTFVNGQRVTGALALSDGDRIALGQRVAYRMR